MPPRKHIYASGNWSIIALGHDLSLIYHQAITQTNADLLSFGPLRTNLNETRMKIINFSFKRVHLKM